jgi:hypothetical protein
MCPILAAAAANVNGGTPVLPASFHFGGEDERRVHVDVACAASSPSARRACDWRKKVAAVAQKTSFAAYQPSCHRCEILHLHFQRGPCAQHMVQQVAHGNIHGSRKDAPMQRALRVEHGFHGFERDYTRVIGITHVHAEQARQKKGAEFLLFLAQGTGEHLFALLGKAVFAFHRIVSMPAAQCRA